MRREIRNVVASLMGLALVGGAAAGCGAGSSSSSGTPSSHYVLTVATTAGPLSRNFNPFLPTSVSDTDSVASFIYEPLVQLNPLEPKKPIPWLSTSWAWSNGDHTLTMQLRQGVKWSDGSPFTSADVAFTFNLLKKYPAINTGGVTFESVAASGPHTVVFKFAKPGYSQFYNLCQVYIVSQKAWSKVNPTTYADSNPVGTGPYTLTSFSTQGFVLTKNSNYWQKGKPVVYQLRFPSYDGNGPANVAVENGTSQWSGQFIPNIKKLYLNKSKYNNNWSPATSQVALVPNLSKYPLNQLPVREAINDALNRQYIAQESESGQATAQTNMTGILPDESTFISPQYKNSTYQYNPSESKKILEAAGWKPGAGGTMSKGGKPLNLTLTENSGFSDYMTGSQVIAQELDAAGFHVTVSGVSNNSWTADLTDGNFELTTDYSNSEGLDPEIIYAGWLDDALIHGNNAGADFGRWRDAKTQSYFTEYLTSSTNAERQKAIEGLEGVMVKDVPVFVLYGGPDWTQYNDKTLVGWPSPSDPYDPGAPFAPNNEVVVLHLHFRGK